MKSLLFKNIKHIFFLLLFCSLLHAQAPQRISYQAVIRNISGVLVANTNVGIKISILQGNISGTVVYSETHIVVTNVNGLASLEIGGGLLESGDFTTINWSNGPYFIKTETDPAGGINYTISGTSQLLSVPYALHAKLAEKVVSPVYINQNGIGTDTSVRNTTVIDPFISITVPENGKYLVIMNGATTNLNQYGGLVGFAYDRDCIMGVMKNGFFLNLAANTSKKVEYVSEGLIYMYYLNFPQSVSGIIDLVQGDVLTAGYVLYTTNSPTPTGLWSYYTSSFSILKVSD